MFDVVALGESLIDFTPNRTNAQGIAETGLLPWGEYKITETGVPDGYLDAGYTANAWIK